MESRSLPLLPLTLAEDQLGFFRWGRLGGKVLVTNDAADWAFLSESEFDELLAGRITAGHPRFEELQRKAVLRDGLDLDAFAARLAQRNRHVRRGLYVHVVTLTARRGPGAEPIDGAALDMSRETAEKIVDLAMQSPSPAITFELQADGGEPLLNVDVLRHFVDHAQERNRRSDGKTLSFRLLSNLTAMTEDIAEWLIAHEVRLSTSLDGPASLHDWNRRWKGGSAHADVVRWIEFINRRYAELGHDPHVWQVEGLLTATRRTLESGREVVDEYVTRGMRTILLRPLDRYRFDAETWKAIGYSAEEYLDFYRRTLDYIVDLHRRGLELMERTAAVVLTKMLTADDPGAVDIQSPCGAGTSQIAYGVDGRMFPNDEARILAGMGDPIFELGGLGELSIAELVRHPTVRALAAASLLDAQPMCADCWNKPFCGFNPVRNFLTQGDIFGQRPRCFECKEHMAVSRKLFELLADDSDAATAEVLKRWPVMRPPSAIDGRVSNEAP